MRTEIMVPFAFDTAPIEEMLQKHGKDEAMRMLREMVEENVISQLPKKRTYYGTTDEPDWHGMMEECFADWLNEHKEEVIDEAALLLAAKAGRTKKWRELLTEIKEDENV